MNYTKVAGWGLALWAISFVIGSILMIIPGVGIESIWFKIIMLVAMLFATYLIATKVKMKDMQYAFMTGLLWVFILFVLDYLVLVLGFNNGDTAAVYTWSLWTGYAIVLLMPMKLQIMKNKKK